MNKKHTRRNAIKLGGAAALGIAAFPSILSAQTGSLSDIKKRGYLLYGFNGEKPYNYMDAEGNLTGSEIDLARAIAKNIGIDEVQGVAMNFDSFIPAIMAGRIDTCLPIFVKPPRCEKIQYCRSHLIEGQSAVVSSGNPKGINGWDDLVNKDVKIGLIAGTTPNEIAKSAGVDDGKITRFQDTTTMSAGMKSNRVDVIVEATSTIRLMYEELDNSKFERVSSWSKPSNYSGSITFFAAYPFSLDASDLKDAFDSQLKAMLANGEVNNITGKYGFGQADRPAAGDPSIQDICAG